MNNNYLPFNKYPKIAPKEVIKPNWINDLPNLDNIKSSILTYGLGKSYGDVCLNGEGSIIDYSQINHIISFNKEEGIIECEAGITLAEILDVIVPEGWFLPVTPGTKFVTLGGAIANDIHGKNHHKNGTFGNHIIDFKLNRSDNKVFQCNKTENQELFNATIGGLGLTGLIESAKFKLKKINNPYMKVDFIKFKNLDEFFEINKESEKHFDYTVSWVDCTSKGKSLGRGIYMRGNHLNEKPNKIDVDKNENPKPFPIEKKFINDFSVRLFNKLYYGKQFKKFETKIVHYDPYFYPLDSVLNWENAYGKNGFLQHQFVIPFNDCNENFKKIFKMIVESGLSSFLTVLKTFGEVKSPGMLSFPKPGITLAIDYRMEGKKTLHFLNEVDKLVVEFDGKLYPAKDARMSKDNFHKFYPQFEEFLKYKDPKFNSEFYRRICQ